MIIITVFTEFYSLMKIYRIDINRTIVTAFFICKTLSRAYFLKKVIKKLSIHSLNPNVIVNINN